jgi:hypothetical protein
MKIDSSIQIKNCLKIDNKFNEIFISLVITNLDNILNLSKSEYKQIINHTLPIYKYGISTQGTFIIMPLIGIKYNNQLITNMRELLDMNHNSLLKKVIHNDDKDIFTAYDIFISKKINEYLETIRILQKHLQFINSDVKLNNIFIKETQTNNNNSKEYDKLNQYGFITNFELILSDLEKSSININNIKITTKPRLPLKVMLFSLINMGFVYDVRYSCDMTMKKCSSINIMDFDIICMIIDLLVQLIRIDKNILNKLPELCKLLLNFIGANVFFKLKKIIEKGNYKIDKNYSYLIGKIIIKICKKF